VAQVQDIGGSLKSSKEQERRTPADEPYGFRSFWRAPDARRFTAVTWKPPR